MFLMSLHLRYPYGAEQRRPNRAVSMTLCCQQNVTRDMWACVLLSLSICVVVGEPSGLSIFHLVDGCVCLCVYCLNRGAACLPASSGPRLKTQQGYWKQKRMGLVAVCECVFLCNGEEVEAARPPFRSPHGVPR